MIYLESFLKNEVISLEDEYNAGPIKSVTLKTKWHKLSERDKCEMAPIDMVICFLLLCSWLGEEKEKAVLKLLLVGQEHWFKNFPNISQREFGTLKMGMSNDSHFRVYNSI